ncbi:hypothetical protein MRX96_021667 [Rhipicephalus microplus]
MSSNPNFPFCKNKPPSCSSLAARSFRLHGRLSQLFGCFFVRDIFSGVHKQARSVPLEKLVRPLQRRVHHFDVVDGV